MCLGEVEGVGLGRRSWMINWLLCGMGWDVVIDLVERSYEDGEVV